MVELIGINLRNNNNEEVAIDAQTGINSIQTLKELSELEQMITKRKTEIQEALETGGDYLAHAPEGVKQYFATVPHDQAMELKKIFKYTPGEIIAHLNGKIFTFIYVDPTHIKTDAEEEDIKRHEGTGYFQFNAANEYADNEGGDTHIAPTQVYEEFLEAMPAKDFKRLNMPSVAAAQLVGMLWGKLSGEWNIDRSRDIDKKTRLWLGVGKDSHPNDAEVIESDGKTGKINPASKLNQYPFIMLKDRKYMTMS